MDAEQLISGAGVYITRGGRLVFITGVDEEAEHSEIFFSGYMIVLSQSRKTSHEHHLWSASGHCQTPGQSDLDIVGQV